MKLSNKLYWFSDEASPILFRLLKPRSQLIKTRSQLGTTQKVAVVFRHYKTAARLTLARRLYRHCLATNTAFRFGWLPPSPASNSSTSQGRTPHSLTPHSPAIGENLHLPAGIKPPPWALKANTSTSVHNLKELRTAQKNRTPVVFISPVFATPSHPLPNKLSAKYPSPKYLPKSPSHKSTPLGRYGLFCLLKQAPRLKAYALGGIATATDAKRLQGMPLAGLAGHRFLFHLRTAKYAGKLE